jgi:hypothetical protein
VAATPPVVFVAPLAAGSPDAADPEPLGPPGEQDEVQPGCGAGVVQIPPTQTGGGLVLIGGVGVGTGVGRQMTRMQGGLGVGVGSGGVGAGVGVGRGRLGVGIGSEGSVGVGSGRLIVGVGSGRPIVGVGKGTWGAATAVPDGAALPCADATAPRMTLAPAQTSAADAELASQRGNPRLKRTRPMIGTCAKNAANASACRRTPNYNRRAPGSASSVG